MPGGYGGSGASFRNLILLVSVVLNAALALIVANFMGGSLPPGSDGAWDEYDRYDGRKGPPPPSPARPPIMSPLSSFHTVINSTIR